MRTNETRLSILVLALALTGCWEPKSHDALQSDDGAAPGGPWSVCEDAAVGGVSGDGCAFPDGLAACFIPEWELSGPIREAPEGVWPATFQTGAGCLSSRGTLIRSERWQSTSEPPTDRCEVSQAIRTIDGCISLSHCSLTSTYCVPDELLPLMSEGAPVVLESAEDCEALLGDLEARPGSPCSGDQICDVGFPTTPAELGASEPLLVWCSAGWLRFSATTEDASSYENVASVRPRI